MSLSITPFLDPLPIPWLIQIRSAFLTFSIIVRYRLIDTTMSIEFSCISSIWLDKKRKPQSRAEKKRTEKRREEKRKRRERERGDSNVWNERKRREEKRREEKRMRKRKRRFKCLKWKKEKRREEKCLDSHFEMFGTRMSQLSFMLGLGAVSHVMSC